ncbi:hypothetical protein J5X84_33340 [Streptosporangiaceae bacterium NEAU-GS5]|nr:hypothetical protein [Streptosporangiaceae bacterium NEAU-GS5]
MDSAIGILAFLVGVSAGLFVLVALVVMLPKNSWPAESIASDVIWFGGPSGSEHGVSSISQVLTGEQAHWAPGANVDWPQLADMSEPGRHLGGASAGW